jgi:MoxR-like ATPase
MDRFFMRLQMGYPAYAAELSILQSAAQRRNYDLLDLEPVATRAEIVEIQHWTPQVYVEDTVIEYILKIVGATRTEAEFQAGISTRGSLALKLAAQAAALCDGRAFVIPADVQQVVRPICVHRLALKRATADSLEERRIVEGLLGQILDKISAPA